MSRLVCLLVPDLPVAAVCRADPDLAGLPLALVETPGPHAPLVAVSAAACARGVRAGRHTVAQGRAITAALVVRPRDAAAEASAMRALAEVAASLASRIEVTAGGVVFADAAGATHLVDNEAGLATALIARAARVGLTARAAVAASMTVARLAALRAADGVEVVPAGTECGFLAPLPLACLGTPLAPRLAVTLERWGVRTLGDLARLPLAEVATRLGAVGAALVRAARGEDERPFAPQPLSGALEEALGLDHPLDTLEPLLFVLRGLLERVVARMGLEGVGCARVDLALGLDDRSRDVRTLALAAPTRDVKTLVTCLRAELEARPPRAAIVAVAVTAVPERVRPAQLGLFTPPGPAPEQLATLLARLSALCGTERVGAPVVVDSHRPAVAATTPFRLAAGAGPAAPSAPEPTLVVRALRPPRALEVFCDRDRPDFVRGPGLGGRVITAAGPWRVAAEWWSAAAFARDYYDFELSDGGVYRCYRECGSGGWYADGVYD